MCYYATTDYACGDWKWGNMKERCPRQHRMGETCGAKLVDHQNITRSPDPCRTCQDIETKRRRLRKEQENIARWSREGSKFSASIEKAREEAQRLEQTIRALYQKRPKVVMEMNGQASGLGGSGSGHASSIASSQSNLPPIGYASGSAPRHAPSGHTTYVSNQVHRQQTGHANAQGHRHAPATQGSQPSRQTPSYSGESASRHPVSYHSASAMGR